MTEETVSPQELKSFWNDIFQHKPVGVKRSKTTTLPADRTLGAPVTVKELKASIGKLKDQMD